MHVELRIRSLPSVDEPDVTVDYVTLTAYEELKKDLDAANIDIRQLRKNKAVLDSEVEEFKRVNQGFLEQKEELDSMALFIRQNYADEIGMGQHGAFKNIAQCAIYYMGRERIMKAKVEKLEQLVDRLRGGDRG